MDAYLLAAYACRAVAVLLVLGLVGAILASRWTGAPAGSAAVGSGLQTKDGHGSRASADSSAGVKFSEEALP